MRRRARLGDDRAVAVAHGDHADHLERDQGLAEGGPADAETLGELALGRDPVAGLEPVVGDPGGDLLGHLLVEAAAHEPAGEGGPGSGEVASCGRVY